MRANHLLSTAAFGLALLAATSCASEAEPGSPDTEMAAAETDGDADDDESSVDGTATGIEDVEMVREGHVLHEFADAPVVVDDGVRVGAVLLAIASLDAPEVAIPLEQPLPDTATVFGLQIVVINESDEPVVVRAAEADVVVGEERVAADTLAAETFAGPMDPGGEDTGQVVWQLETPFDEVLASAAVDYLVEVETNDGTVREVVLPVTWS